MVTSSLSEKSTDQLGKRVGGVTPPAPTSFYSRAGIFKPLWSPGIDTKASNPPAYVAWRAGTITLFLLGA
jgi:hypothetical protein